MTSTTRKVAGSSKSTSSKVVRTGNATLREKGTFTGVSWKPKRLELDSDYLVIINTSNNKRIRISLRDITQLERTDLTDHSLGLKAKDKKYNFSFTSDPELYDWQEDIYQRCPLGGYSAPFGFEHKSHIGSDAVTGTFTDPTLIPIYAEIIGTTPSMIHTSPTTTAAVVVTPRSRPVSGAPLKAAVTTTPAGPAVTTSVLEGSFIVKQKGGLFGWRAKVRWVSLTPQTIVLHSRASKNSPISKSFQLSTLLRIEPDSKNESCLEIEYSLSPPSKTHQPHLASPTDMFVISFNDMAELYTWRDALYLRSSLSSPIGTPTNFKHHIHVGFDAVTGMFSGLPADWQALLNPGSSGKPASSANGNGSQADRKAKRASRRQSAMQVAGVGA
ncbi:hypothetical protein BJ165DRAFT_1405933 [Panaeolus papilionaceus]|nr:hypothetical protein BJ165DRAFT_1405933 [Panaeolus papilionaceus]